MGKLPVQNIWDFFIDLSTYLHIDHIIRWKDQYPHWRMTESMAKKKKMPGNDVPGFCQAGKGQFCVSNTGSLIIIFKGWIEWIFKKENEFRSFLNLPTNKYDVRNFIPTYLKQFSRPLTEEAKADPDYRQVFSKPLKPLWHWCNTSRFQLSFPAYQIFCTCC